MTSVPNAPAACARAAAAHIAAMPPFMSAAPRPYMLPSRTSAPNGACVMPPVPTTSRCPLSSRAPRPAARGPMRATTLGRRGSASDTSTANPHARSTSASSRAHAPSPGPSGASAGLRESMRTNSAANARASPVGIGPCMGAAVTASTEQRRRYGAADTASLPVRLKVQDAVSAARYQPRGIGRAVSSERAPSVLFDGDAGAVDAHRYQLAQLGHRRTHVSLAPMRRERQHAAATRRAERLRA